MRSTKTLSVTGYTVEYVDLRAPKPRPRITETAVLDKDAIEAACCLGIDVPDVIRRRYEMAGYHVLGVLKEVRRPVEVDLLTLYQQVRAAEEATAAMPADAADDQS